MPYSVSSSSGGTPAGENTQLQYNNSGAFGASANLTFGSDILTLAGTQNITGQLNADNLRLDGNTLSVTNENGNLVLAPNGTGIVSLTGTQTITGRLNVDNLRLDGNTLSSLSGDLLLSAESGYIKSVDKQLQLSRIDSSPVKIENNGESGALIDFAGESSSSTETPVTTYGVGAVSGTVSGPTSGCWSCEYMLQVEINSSTCFIPAYVEGN
ncbi:MAG: hypothetical protein JXD22_11700 [Sedimentisphaerales bacterium]|nr:hypothetical protein [Sedimentisphaerales bacterium]